MGNQESVPSYLYCNRCHSPPSANVQADTWVCSCCGHHNNQSILPADCKTIHVNRPIAAMSNEGNSIDNFIIENGQADPPSAVQPSEDNTCLSSTDEPIPIDVGSSKEDAKCETIELLSTAIASEIPLRHSENTNGLDVTPHNFGKICGSSLKLSPFVASNKMDMREQNLTNSVEHDTMPEGYVDGYVVDPLLHFNLPKTYNSVQLGNLDAKLLIIEKRLIRLVRATTDMQICLSQLPDLYSSKYGQLLDHKVHGYLELKDLLSEFYSLRVSSQGSIFWLSLANAEHKHYLAIQPNVTSGKSVTSGSSDAEILLQQQLLQLLDATQTRQIQLSTLPLLYQSHFSKKLDYKALGYTKLKSLLNSMPSLSVSGGQVGTEYLYQTCQDSLHIPDRNVCTTRQNETNATALFLSPKSALQSKTPISKLSKHPWLLEKQLVVIIKESKEMGMLVSQLPALFMKRYSSKFMPRNDKDPAQMKSLFESMRTLRLYERHGDLYLGLVAPKLFLIAWHRVCAQIIKSTSLYKKILHIVAGHANGAKTSDVMKAIPSFGFYLGQMAQAAQLPCISPLAVLRLCDGVECDMDNRLFRSQDIQSPTATIEACATAQVDDSQSSLPNETDLKIALGCLHRLRGSFEESGRWPATRKHLSAFLFNGEEVLDLSHLRSWCDSVGGETKACRRLIVLFNTLGCVVGISSNLKWNLPNVFQVLSEQPSAEDLHKTTTVPCEVVPETGITENLEHGEAGHDSVCSAALIEKPMLTTNQVIFSQEADETEHEKATSSSFVNKGIRVAPQELTHYTVQRNMVELQEQLDYIKMLSPFNRVGGTQDSRQDFVSIDCEGVPSELSLIQVCVFDHINMSHHVYIFDCVKLRPSSVCDMMSDMFMDPCVTKLFHDLHNDAVALSEIGGVKSLHGTLDTQLAMEYVTGDLFVGFNKMLEQLGQEKHPLKNAMKDRMKDRQLFTRRPLSPDVLEYASLDVSLLLKAKDKLLAMLGDDTTMRSIIRASDARAASASQNGGSRQLCFDVSNDHAIASHELLAEFRPADVLVGSRLEVSNDASILLNMLPEDLQDALVDSSEDLSDITLDTGRPPHAWIKGQRTLLGNENRIIESCDIESIVDQLGGFGLDNRAGLEQQLHRISAIRNRKSDIIGLTMRVGRHVSGNATMVADLLFGDPDRCILLMGEPGSGKTTVVREVTRLLAERFNVFVVDTSNEIAGDGDVPHPCVGLARRMMVPRLDKQGDIMIECVQNHTPEVMVIDEIGRPPEVDAARTCKQRGVRLIASAHGDLRKLIKNPKLRGLIGGIETVTLGDVQAKAEAKKSGHGFQKLKAQRAGAPVFNTIVELHRGAHHEWRIIMDVASAVDKVLEGGEYLTQRRTRDPNTGAIQLHLEKA